MFCSYLIFFSGFIKIQKNFQICLIFLVHTKVVDNKTQKNHSFMKMQGRKGKCKDDIKSYSLDRLEQVERSKSKGKGLEKMGIRLPATCRSGAVCSSKVQGWAGLHNKAVSDHRLTVYIT